MPDTVLALIGACCGGYAEPVRICLFETIELCNSLDA